MILSCQNVSKSFGIDEIIRNASFEIDNYEKAAIVGLNGCGKSTMLKIIMGELSSDSGNVIIAKDKTIGFLGQFQEFQENNTIYQEVLTIKQDVIEMENQIRTLEKEIASSKGEKLKELLGRYDRLNHQFELINGYAYKSEVAGILKGLGFEEEDFDKPVNSLSGGQKTRLSLSKLLVKKPDLILLDEPTNHLDIESIEWLEGFLSNYKGAVLVVAHDRYFLDKIVNKVIHIENGDVRVFKGNYTDFAKHSAQIREIQLKHYYNQQEEIKRQEEVIAKLKSFNREKSIKRAESREKALDKIDRLEKPKEKASRMKIQLKPSKLSGNDVLTVEEISKTFGSNELFSKLSFQIKRGEHVALIGQNGAGKTTILKMVNNLLDADSGNISLGSKVEIGYYDQEQMVLDMEKTLFDEISDSFPELTETQIRNTLAAFLFTGDDVFKYIRDLSGGERGRVSLAKLMLSSCNFLILDEPTNHLDIDSKEILEEVIRNYSGTVLYVSHDRYFVNETATRILSLENKKLTNYLGNYDYYLLKRNENKTNTVDTDESNNISNSVSKDEWQKQKKEAAIQKKKEREIEKCEKEIEKLEAEIADIDSEMLKDENTNNAAILMQLQKDKEEKNSELSKYYQQWEELMG
ncbi:ATP-binding cassette, subfamily F, member 3 [Acetitomaculum ruminis DSM 5522]|uniref:ATP-binding cassette, subfamily F, member 3 n=1 Tax=Acetitomaculum ruminis DSM 5522 TaxID=1120918 RepID=A0A1I0V760_9FIRM|nr:ABC-F family ATP-binding cassette domain-containing protein [Acetitomaculum ruminis]SFA72179.1 ATP-binding cassette, subfamily F, member 3 [Acetitomaculum ruminis DSM 5522]